MKVASLEKKRFYAQNASEGLVINDRKLSFSDFKSSVPTNAGDKHTLGKIHYRIDCSYSNPAEYNGELHFDFIVQCLFIPSKSWIRNEGDSSTLSHEQVHHDINRVHAAELKNELAYRGYDQLNYRVQIDNIRKTIKNKYEIIHAEFDIEDQRDIKNTLNWRVRVDKALEAGRFFIE